MGDEVGNQGEIPNEINYEVPALQENLEGNHIIGLITVKLDPVLGLVLVLGIFSLFLGVRLTYIEELESLNQKLVEERKENLQHLQFIQTLQELNVSLSESLSKMEQYNSDLRLNVDDLRQNIKKEQQKIAQLLQELEILQQSYAEQINRLQEIQYSYTEQSDRLQEIQYIVETYQNQADLINKIDRNIEKLEICYSWLETYCSIKSKAFKSNRDYEKLERYTRYLGCKNELPADHIIKIKDSFEERINLRLQAKKFQVDLFINGDLDKMKAEQNKTKSLPVETCQFVCELEESCDTQWSTREPIIQQTNETAYKPTNEVMVENNLLSTIITYGTKIIYNFGRYLAGFFFS